MVSGILLDPSHLLRKDAVDHGRHRGRELGAGLGKVYLVMELLFLYSIFVNVRPKDGVNWEFYLLMILYAYKLALGVKMLMAPGILETTCTSQAYQQEFLAVTLRSTLARKGRYCAS